MAKKRKKTNDIEIENQNSQSEENVEQPKVTQNEPQAELETIGSFLSAGRDSKGLSLKIVSQHTKISLTNLESLESDRLDQLPNKAYVAGYVKSYVKLLGLDMDRGLELLEYTYTGAKPVATVQPHKNEGTKQTTPPRKSLSREQKDLMIKGGLGLLGVVILAVILTVIGGNDKTETPVVKKKEINITPQRVSAETPLQTEPTAIPEEKAEKKVVQKKPEEKIKPKEEKKKVEEKVVEKKEEKVEEKIAEKKEEKPKEEKKKEKKKFYPLGSNLYSFDTSLKQEEIDELIPENFKNAVVTGKQNVLITAVKEDSWLTYKSDEDPIKKFVLKKGKSVLIRGSETRIFIGNLGAVKIFLNNKPLDIKSRTGVKSLVFPQENKDKYVMPLFVFKKDGSVQTSDEYLAEEGDEEDNP